jgi:hypothetical protein
MTMKHNGRTFRRMNAAGPPTRMPRGSDAPNGQPAPKPTEPEPLPPHMPVDAPTVELPAEQPHAPGEFMTEEELELELLTRPDEGP